MTSTTKKPHVQFSGSNSFSTNLDAKRADFDVLDAMIAKAGDVETLLAIHAQCVEDQDWDNWAEIEAAGMQAAWDAIKDDCDQNRLEKIETAFFSSNTCIDFYA